MRRPALLLLPAIVLVLSACAGSRGDLPYAESVPEVTCADGSQQSQGLPVPGRVPHGFDAVAAYRCDALATVDDAQGRWSASTRERLEGDLGPLLTALAEPDDPGWSGPCTAIGIIVPELWLVDATGEAIRVSYPVTGCGLPKTDAITAALGALTVVETVNHKRALIESRAATEAGCPTSWSATALHVVGPGDLAPEGGAPRERGEGRSAPAPLPDGTTTPVPDPILPSNSDVDGMLVCDYSTDPAEAPPPVLGPGDTVTSAVTAAGSGRFTGARTLDADAAHAILDGVRSAAADDLQCTLTPGRFVLLSPSRGEQVVGLQIIVELDGCQRLTRSWVTSLAAPPEVLAILGVGEDGTG